MKARYGPITLSPPLSMSLSRRSHLDLLRGPRPSLEPRVEVVLEGLELRTERAGRRGAIGTRVKRRVLERCHHARDLGFQRRDRGLRLLELALRAAQVFPRIAFRGWGHLVAFVHLPQDRKSTRLSSSHGYISYPVLCLKKKVPRSIPGAAVDDELVRFLRVLEIVLEHPEDRLLPPALAP